MIVVMSMTKVTPKMIAEFIDYLRASDDDVIAEQGK